MKKRLVGGNFLLDLAMLTLVDSVDEETFTEISNEEVIEQLDVLKQYIHNEESIKPVWVKLKDDSNVIVTRGEVAKVIGDEEFAIKVKFKKKVLTIHVEFTQMTDSDSQPIDYYYIASGDAEYNLSSADYVTKEDASNLTKYVEVDDITQLSDSFIKSLNFGDCVYDKATIKSFIFERNSSDRIFIHYNYYNRTMTNVCYVEMLGTGWVYDSTYTQSLALASDVKQYKVYSFGFKKNNKQYTILFVSPANLNINSLNISSIPTMRGGKIVIPLYASQEDVGNGGAVYIDCNFVPQAVNEIKATFIDETTGTIKQLSIDGSDTITDVSLSEVGIIN